MNKITDWFKSLELEIIIILILILIGLIIAIYTLIKNHKIYSAIAKKTLSAKEDLILEDEVYKVRVVVTNIGYTNTVIKELGFIYKQTKLPTVTEEFNLTARNFNSTVIPIEELRTFVLGDKNKVKKFHFYVVDSINRTTKTKMKLSYKYIKKQINSENNEARKIELQNKKALKLANKEARYESGEYTFGDKTYLIFAAIFSPLMKLFKFIGKKINQGLYNREIKKQVKVELLKEQKAMIAEENLKREEALKEKTSKKYSNKLDKKNEKRLRKNELKDNKKSLDSNVHIEDQEQVNIEDEFDTIGNNDDVDINIESDDVIDNEESLDSIAHNEDQKQVDIEDESDTIENNDDVDINIESDDIVDNKE